MMNNEVFYIISRIEQIAEDIKGDTGGGCPVAKSVLMGFLAHRMSLQTYVEIGVYRGRSLLPVAAVMQENGGTAYGIDPFLDNLFVENEVPEHLSNVVQEFAAQVNLSDIYNDVLRSVDEYALSNSVKILRKTSADGIEEIRSQISRIDMLHIDGNHDYAMVNQDINTYLPLLASDGIIVLDDINWPGVAANYEELKSTGMYNILLEDTYFAVLIKKSASEKKCREVLRLQQETTELYARMKDYDAHHEIKKHQGSSAVPRPVVAVGITAYKHENYIEKCIQSVLAQRGSFDLRVIIAEDCSGDRTASIIRRALLENTNRKATVHFIENEKNLGLIPNLMQVFKAFGKCDYFTFCEGDDYWTDKYKIQKHINLLNAHHNCAMSFNRLTLLWEEQKTYEEYAPQLELSAKGSTMISPYELADFNIIGTLSCSFYVGKYLEKIDYSIFTDNLSDWMFNLYFSYSFGDIGMLDEPLTVYRKHNQSSWTGMPETKKWTTLAEILDSYNTYFDFEFDSKFQHTKDNLAKEYQYATKEPMRAYDLLIIDDVFPNPLSGFRLEELGAYLKEIPSSYLMNCGAEEGILGAGRTEDVIREFRIQHPALGNQISRINKDIKVGARLAYCVFIANAFYNIDYLEQNQIPFVVELYPGGAFLPNDAESDYRLARVFCSPCFVKVITTQKRTYDYLIQKKLCPAEQIVHIFGVVTPTQALQRPNTDIRHYGMEKDTLDICFVAFKYTQRGEDKGYDLFIETAKILVKECPNIYFHVAGGFDETVIDVSQMQGRISFYGKLSSEELQTFYADKDIILSPNISGKISKGAFDGFPTGSCTESALSETAMFCTDEFGSNQGYFVEGEEIVIIPHNADNIARIIEGYYHTPEKLKSIGVQGAQKVRKLYSFENQMEPRMQVLREEIAVSISGQRKVEALSPPSKAALIISRMSQKPFLRKCALGAKHILPKGVKNLMKKVYRKICGRYA